MLRNLIRGVSKSYPRCLEILYAASRNLSDVSESFPRSLGILSATSRDSVHGNFEMSQVSQRCLEILSSPRHPEIESEVSRYLMSRDCTRGDRDLLHGIFRSFSQCLETFNRGTPFPTSLRNCYSSENDIPEEVIPREMIFQRKLFLRK